MINDKQCKEHILNKSQQEAKTFIEDIQFELNIKEKKSNVNVDQAFMLLMSMLIIAFILLIIAIIGLKLSQIYSIKLLDGVAISLGTVLALFFIGLFVKIWHGNYFFEKGRHWKILPISFILVMLLSVWWPIIRIEFISAQDKLFGIPWYLTDHFPRMLFGALFIGCLGYFIIKYRRGYH